MPRSFAALAAALLLAGPFPLLAQDDPVAASRAAYADAVRAYQARDYPGFLRHAELAARLRPAHGGALYNLACARALAGDTAGALDALRRYAGLGYAGDAAADADLASLRGLAAFDSLGTALAANARPIVLSRRAFTLDERDLLTEGIGYDARTRAFYVGSVHRRKILRVDPAGRTSLLADGARAGFLAPMGMSVDAARRVLWVATAARPQMMGYAPADSLRSALVRIDLTSGRVTGRFEVPPDGAPHVLGDVIVSSAGDVYATDSRSPLIVRIAAGRDTLERFVTSPLLTAAQGLALSADERSLYVADYARGILRVDVATRALRLLGAGPRVLALGIDGLYRVDDALIGVQNGVTPHRVVRLALDAAGDSITAATVLERAHPDYAEPTLGVVVGNDLYYIARSQWERFGEDGSVAPADSLQAPVVLRLPLPRRR